MVSGRLRAQWESGGYESVFEINDLAVLGDLAPNFLLGVPWARPTLLCGRLEFPAGELAPDRVRAGNLARWRARPLHHRQAVLDLLGNERV